MNVRQSSDVLRRSTDAVDVDDDFDDQVGQVETAIESIREGAEVAFDVDTMRCWTRWVWPAGSGVDACFARVGQARSEPHPAGRQVPMSMNGSALSIPGS